jgi:capsular polysaccharide transport system permease protein
MSQPIPVPKHSPWVSQVLVIRALLQREIATRFGEYSLGFFWMLLEPLLGVLVIGVLLGSIGARTAPPDIPYAFFVLNGMLLLGLFTGAMSTGVNAISANVGLLVYPNVRPLDTFIARFIYELMETVFSFTLFCLISMWIGVNISLEHLDMLIYCFIATWMMGCGLGLTFGVIAAHFKETEKIVGVLQRPLMFVSAVLFPLSIIPAHAQEYLLYNPLAHTIELSRKALFPYYHVDGVNIIYPIQITIIFIGIGAIFFQLNRNFLTQNR